MSELEIKSHVRYLTNAVGEKTDVLVPLEVWEKILAALEIENGQTESGLSPIDEQEPISQILLDLKTAVQEVRAGQTTPVSELWNDIDSIS